MSDQETEKEINSIQDILEMMNPEVHMNLKTAVELGKWPDGRKLTDEQRANCLQAIIAYERANLPEEQRVGYIDRSGQKKTHCDDPVAADETVPLNIIKH